MSRIEVVAEAPRVGVAGQKVVCPKCLALIGVLAMEIRDWRALGFANDVGVDAIRFAPGQRHVAGEPAVCCQCGGSYLERETSLRRGDQLFLHTDVGWIPRKPMSAGGNPEFGQVEWANFG